MSRCQRTRRLAIVDPNLSERAASYRSVAELIDLTPTRPLASAASPDRKEKP